MSKFFEKFRIYKKEGRVLVSEGSSPLRISKILSNTPIANGEYILVGVYTINGKEETTEIEIPSFKTGLIVPDIYAIGSNYVTGRYEGITPNKISLMVNDER